MISRVMADHADRLGAIIGVLEVLQSRFDSIDPRMDGIEHKISEIEPKTILNEQDLRKVAQSVLENDTNLKSVVDANDAFVKQQLATNDQELKAKMEEMNAKIQEISRVSSPDSSRGGRVGTGEAGVDAAARSKIEEVDRTLKTLEQEMKGFSADIRRTIDDVHRHTGEAAHRAGERMSAIEHQLAQIQRTTTSAGAASASQQQQQQREQATRDPFTESDPWGRGGVNESTTAAGWTFVEQGDGAQYPKFQAQMRKEAKVAFFAIGERKSVFEDKVAVSPTGQYTENDSQGWIRTTSNYLVSKAFEMAAFLPWAESAQSQQIAHSHVNALSECGMMCSVEPLQLPRDLWGYLNLALTGRQKMAFNNCPQGNGFEAWRRIVVPMAPRSDARLHDMQSDINVPAKSKRLGDVMDDIEAWEGRLLDYYKCGGDHMSDKTKIIVCLRMLPPTTPSSLKMALKDLKDFEVFKDELRNNIKYLQDFGGLAAAHLMGEEEASSLGDPAPAPSRGGGWPEDDQEVAITERDLPAFCRTLPARRGMDS